MSTVADAGFSGRSAVLLPTPSLAWEQFEDFVERLLSAHRFCAQLARHVVRVERWGRRGDKQDGIDFEGHLSDGTKVCWQCKRQTALTPGDVRTAVAACSFDAGLHYLVFSGEASSGARNEMAKHSGWELLDQRGLGRLLDDLPLHKRRDVLDDTWDVATRRQLLRVPGEDAFLSLGTFAADRRRPDMVVNDLGPRVGREQEMQALRSGLSADAAQPPVVVVTGPGGSGKTRLLIEVLIEQEESRPDVPILCLSPGRTVDAAAISELQHIPAVIVVDDAHQDPAAVAPLLHYARQTSGTQLVFSARPSGVSALRAEIVKAGQFGSSVQTVELGQLSRTVARALVDSLMGDLGVRAPVREYFTGQAMDSPYVAVIAASLIRRGELTAPIVVDAGLREQVLARYEELAAGDLGGVPASTVRRALAIYAALGPVDDSELHDDIARLCDVTRTEVLRVREGLDDRGVLVTRGGMTRVVPDVLADDLLEGEAAVGGFATGFVDELWAAFRDTHTARLVVALAELDWRLNRRGGPHVMAPIWAALRTEMRAADPEDICDRLHMLGPLATTQPLALVAFLDEIRARLHAEEMISGSADINPFGDRGTAARNGSPSNADPGGETPVEWDWSRMIRDADDVRERIPALYGQCVIAAPDLLESALDVLWAFARRDSRPTNQHPQHPLRVLTERWANLADLPHPSFPTRIVDRVQQWLRERADVRDVTTPLAILHPLIAKESDQHFMDDGQLILQSGAVSVEWARPLRDTIRSILLDQANGDDLRRSAAAIDLMGELLRRPIGHYGRTVDREEVLSWESDDLATIDVARRISETTTSAVLRRLLRAEIAWTAEYAMSIPLRHAALTVLTFLDGFEDDLTELMMHNHNGRMPTRRHTVVPTIDQLRASETARAEEERELSPEQREAARSAQVGARVERGMRAGGMLTELVVQQLVALGPPSRIVAVLDSTCREIRAAQPTTNPSLWDLWRNLSLTSPDLVPDIVQAITDDPPGPLDQTLNQLLGAWAQHDEPRCGKWLTNMTDQRIGVRVAIGTAFMDYGWTDRGSAFLDVYRIGRHDTEPAVRERFLMASHRLLITDPAATAADLLTAGITPVAAVRVLEHACSFNGASWGRGLDRREAQAVLELANRAGWENWTLQQLRSGIAGAHPALVLDHLATAHARRRTPSQVEGLAETFSHQAPVLIRWIFDRVNRQQTADTSAVLALVTDGNLTTEQVDHLGIAIDDLDDGALPALIETLQELPTWPLRQPTLARRLLVRARQLSEDAAISARGKIAAAMQLHVWNSADLVRARAAAATCADNETDPQLREDFHAARAKCDSQLTWAANIDDQDD